MGLSGMAVDKRTVYGGVVWTTVEWMKISDFAHIKKPIFFFGLLVLLPFALFSFEEKIKIKQRNQGSVVSVYPQMILVNYYHYLCAIFTTIYYVI